MLACQPNTQLPVIEYLRRRVPFPLRPSRPGQTWIGAGVPTGRSSRLWLHALRRVNRLPVTAMWLPGRRAGLEESEASCNEPRTVQAHEPQMSLLSDSVAGTRQDWHEIDNRADRRVRWKCPHRLLSLRCVSLVVTGIGL